MTGPSKPEPPDSVEGLIAAARAGSPEALGLLLEICRPYLLRVAGAELDTQLRAKAGASDLVQETCLEVQRIFDRFQGGSKGELLAWLRAILLNKGADLTRRYRGVGKRQLGREVPLDRSDSPVKGLVADSSTPSHQAKRHEQAEAVSKALEKLPEHYRQVIIWRQWEELSFAEIARRLKRSPDAARMLWWRAIEKLQQELETSS